MSQEAVFKIKSKSKTYNYWNKQINTAFWMVWFGLFVHPFSHTCNTGHVNYRLQFIYYNTAYNIWTSTQYNI